MQIARNHSKRIPSLVLSLQISSSRADYETALSENCGLTSTAKYSFPKHKIDAERVGYHVEYTVVSCCSLSGISGESGELLPSVLDLVGRVSNQRSVTIRPWLIPTLQLTWIVQVFWLRHI